MNCFSSVRNYPGTGSGYGIRIDKDEVHAPGNGHKYRAVSAGRTYGKWRTPAEAPPAWPTTPGQTVPEFDGLVWECVGPHVRAPQTFNTLGGTTPAVIQDYGYLKADDTSVPFFRTEVSSLTHAEGRLLTHLTSGVSFRTYFQSTYESGPVPGALILPEVWVGSSYYGEHLSGTSRSR
ncbi:hypothetical protein ACWDYJ_33110 [Streptomyces sp. NPDC003042]